MTPSQSKTTSFSITIKEPVSREKSAGFPGELIKKGFHKGVPFFIGARLHNPELDPAATLSYSLEDTAYREFRIKMSRVREQMLTPAGRRMAEERHAFMETFFNQLTRETRGFFP
jgi:hypothetical protein